MREEHRLKHRWKQRKMHKLSSILLALSLIFSISFSAFADMKVPDFNGVNPQNHINKIYNEEKKEALKKNEIRYEDIEDMVHMFNPEVLNNWNSWENNKSANDIYSDYQDAADSLSGGTGESDMMDAMANAQADAMRIQADKNYSDSYTNFLTYYMAEKKLVLSSKILFLNYFKSDYAYAVAEENYNEMARKLESAHNNYSVGNATNVDVLTAEKNMADAQSSLVQAKSAQSTSKRNLIINCGKSMNDDVNIIPSNKDYIEIIKKIDLQDDYKKALANNIQYEIYKRAKENAQTDEVKKEIEINLGAAPQKIFNDMEAKYNAIKDAIDNNRTKEVAYNLAVDTYSQAKNAYQHGNISRKEVLSAESAVKITYSNLLSSYYDIYIAYENYEACVEGLAAC